MTVTTKALDDAGQGVKVPLQDGAAGRVREGIEPGFMVSFH